MSTAFAITIVIPTHNRHAYLRRTVAYYSLWEYPVLIADSSNTPFPTEGLSPATRYVHLPGVSFPQKLQHVFPLVETEFVAMCADDDFLVKDGITECFQFLQANRQYSVADGGVLFYKKEQALQGKLNYHLHYKNALNEDFRQADALHRLQNFFKQYRSVFYGVHYTSNLFYAYKSCGGCFSNLYLNEYLTALYPVAKGLCRILPVLTGVRESAVLSDDKMTANLDTMIENKAYDRELKSYIGCVAQAIHNACDYDTETCRQTVNTLLQDFAMGIAVGKKKEQQQYQSLTKKAGNLVLQFPLMGRAIVEARRRRQSETETAALIKTASDRENLNRISQFIYQYGPL